MPELFIYLIKVNVALLVFCLGYYLVLRRLTFYTLNRVYLVTAIIFSTLYPRIDLTAFMNRHEHISSSMQVIVVNWQGGVNNLAKAATEYNKWFWLQCIFWAGVAFLAIRMIVQLISLHRLHKRSKPAQLHQYIVRTINGNINPFSFWRTIYLNPENHNPAELKAILEHEQVHVNEWHTLDILLGEVSTIFYWFNPGIWLMKRAIRENIEFITDRKILQKGMDSKAYQYSLLNVNFGAQQNTIVNHFNISTIKKRIIMMNAKRSSHINVTRYVVLVPAVMLLLLVFSVSKAQLAKAVNSTAQVVTSIKMAVQDKIDDIAQPVKTTVTQKAQMLSQAKYTNAINDTSKKVNAVIILNEPVQFVHAGNDTNKFAIKVRNVGGEKLKFYVDGKLVESIDTIKPNNIASINVFKNKTNTNGDEKGEGYVFVTTKGEGNGKKTLDQINLLQLNGNFSLDTIRRKVNGNVLYLTKPDADNGGKGQISKVINIRRDGSTIDTAITITGNGKFTMTTKSNFIIKRPDSARKEVVVIGYASKPALTINGVSGDRSNKVSAIDSVLKIVNGKEVTPAQFKKISGGDIESVEIFKGEDALRKYGEKGRKGVIVVTTKKQ